jgi:hypothetical protein
MNLKDACIGKILETFNDIRKMLDMLEIDMREEDLMIQATSVWISRQLVNWYYDFMREIKNIAHKKDEIQQQINEMDKINNENI